MKGLSTNHSCYLVVNVYVFRCCAISVIHFFQSDPGDAFNNWWNTVQNKFDIHSQAVAFASAPLGLDSVIPPRTATPPFHKELARDSSLSSDTDLDEPIVSKLTRRFGLTKDSKSKASSSSPLKTAQRQSTNADDIGEEIFDEGPIFPSRVLFGCLINSQAMSSRSPFF